MKQKITKLYFLFLIGFFLYSCDKDYETGVTTNTATSNEETILGKKLENPFSVKNMQIAYDNLKAEGKIQAKSEIEISATHLYVKFKPKNEKELDILKKDSSLALFDYPLDYEIVATGVSYHDPTLPDSIPTYQYSSVKKDYVFPEGVEYEVLDPLYIPKEYTPEYIHADTLDVETKSTSEVFSDNLVEQALKITNNIKKEAAKTNMTTKSWFVPNKWRPTGTIKLAETRSGSDYFPLEGVKVRVRSWFSWDYGYTDRNGYFETGKFRYSTSYTILWERAYWDIRDGSIWQASYGGPDNKRPWNLNINSNKVFTFAHVHRALHFYYYARPCGIVRPQMSGLKVSVYDEDDIANFNQTRANLPIASHINIYKVRNEEWDGNKIVYKYYGINQFATTIHEMAHAAHWDEVGNVNYALTTKLLKESWAVFVAYLITKDKYPDFKNKRLDYSYQNYDISTIKGTSFEGIYTPMLIDLYDSDNQREKKNNDTSYPIDRVSGYSVEQIQRTLFKSWGVGG